MIESLENKKVKEFIKLKNNKKYRKKQNKFIIEGVRLIFDAIQMDVFFYDLFLTEECATKIQNSKYNITKFKEHLLISEKVAKKMSSVKTPQGAFGVARGFVPFKIEEIKKNDLAVILFGVKDPGNLGTLLRSAFSFGFLKIILVNCCEIYNEKVIRSSMGAIFGLSYLLVDSFLPVLNFFKLRKIKTFATSLSKTSKNSEFLKDKSGVLILGNEAKGLPEQLILNSDETIKIKINKSFESLNVSCAGSILMYEMSKSNPNFV